MENFSIDYYEYPIDIDSPDWFDYTVSENVEKLRIPERILRRMTNTALVTAIHEFPYVCDLYLYNDSIEDGFTSMLSYCSALSELSSRELDADTLASLAAPFVEITANSATECSLDFFRAKATVDILTVLSNSDSTISPNAIVLPPGTPSSVVTPNGSPVSCTINLEQHTSSDHDEYDQIWIVGYPVTRIRVGTCTYNCHSYAWHSRAAINSVRIPNPSVYMTDGSYTRVFQGSSATPINQTGVANGDIIYYGNGAHSAVYIGSTTSSSPISTGMVCSKWGMAGLFEHQLGSVPNEYYPGTISIWRKA